MLVKMTNYLFLGMVLLNILVFINRNKDRDQLIAVAKTLNGETLKDEKKLALLSLIFVVILGIMAYLIRDLIRDYRVIVDFIRPRKLGFLDFISSKNASDYRRVFREPYERLILESGQSFKTSLYYILGLLSFMILTYLNSRVRFEKTGLRIFTSFYDFETAKGYLWSDYGDFWLISREDYIIAKLRFSKEDRLLIEKHLEGLEDLGRPRD